MFNEDPISNFSWPEYTEEDLQHIDHLCEESRLEDPKIDNGAPSIFIEVEGAADRSDKSGNAPQVVDDSPFALFRERRGYLSVTDIVAPAWCEVQFDYGLHQLRSKPLSKRPKVLVTKKGKEICVKADVAAKNERILERGRTVHKKLEREIHKEVPIKAKTREESWALRLLDFLSKLKSSRDTFVCREVPVWGIIHDHAFYGVIDELHLQSSGANCEPNPTLSQGEVRTKESQVQTTLDSFITDAKKIVHASSTNPRFILHILDNKTRKSPYIPSHVDTLPSRLQLMLYWLMLNQALSVSSGGSSFSAFCTRTGADPAKAFSDPFVVEMSALVIENNLSLHFLDAKCLKDMDLPYRESVQDMGLDTEGCVSTRLSLVYRLRGSSAKRSKVSTVDAPTNEPTKIENEMHAPAVVKEIPENPDVTADDRDAKASLPMDVSVDAAESMSHEDLSTPMAVESAEGAITATDRKTASINSSRKRKRQNSRAPPTSTGNAAGETDSVSSSADSDASSADVLASPSPFIVGTKKFLYNAELLDAHISSVLAWWHGQRSPRGVSIEDTGRCDSCEYKNGCEWREQKALELLKQMPTNTVSDSESNARTL